MKEAPKSTVTVNVSFDIDLEYNPFTGRTLDDFLALFEDDLLDAVEELRPEVQNVYQMKIKTTSNV
jgi:hypothetical protein